MLASARALMVPAQLILLDEPFEGLAPAIVQEVMAALDRLRGKVAMVIVEHHAETVLSLVDRAVGLGTGQGAFEGSARAGSRPDLAGPPAGRGAAGIGRRLTAACMLPARRRRPWNRARPRCGWQSPAMIG